MSELEEFLLYVLVNVKNPFVPISANDLYLLYSEFKEQKKEANQ